MFSRGSNLPTVAEIHTAIRWIGEWIFANQDNAARNFREHGRQFDANAYVLRPEDYEIDLSKDGTVFVFITNQARWSAVTYDIMRKVPLREGVCVEEFNKRSAWGVVWYECRMNAVIQHWKAALR